MRKQVWSRGAGKFVTVQTLKSTTAKQHKIAFEQRLVGCPMWWLQRVLSAANSKGQLVVGIYLWRCFSLNKENRTFNLPNNELKALGVKRHTKYRALAVFTKAGLITVQKNGHESLVVTIIAK
jgi:hypothetical protein